MHRPACVKAVNYLLIVIGKVVVLYALSTAKSKYLTSQAFLSPAFWTGLKQPGGLFTQAVTEYSNLLGLAFYTSSPTPMNTTNLNKRILVL